MVEKYKSNASFNRARFTRLLLKTAIRGLLRWRPLADPKPGYTVIIGCNSGLATMLKANLRMLAMQDRSNLDKIIIVFDAPKDKIAVPIEDYARHTFPELPLEFRYYTQWQYEVTRSISWGWVYAWLSWCTGIANVRTRYALLHDFDALLIRGDILEERYQKILAERVEYLGVRYYEGAGVTADDKLAVTFELMFDAAFVRSRFRPIELFNHPTRFKGRRVEFDTFLSAQSQAGTASIHPIDEDSMVHPTQMICQFTDFMNRRNYTPPLETTLPMIPYFCHLAGDSTLLLSISGSFSRASDGVVEFWGRPLSLGRLNPDMAAWLKKQAYRLELALTGDVRPEVSRYFEGIEALARGRQLLQARPARAMANHAESKTEDRRTVIE